MSKELKDWTTHFIKAKDAVQRKLLKIEESGDVLKVHFKDKINNHFIIDKLDETIFKKIDGSEHKTIVCLNEEHNLNFVVKNWSKLSSINNLNFIFVNLKNHEKWLINPKVHSLIADPASISQGLRAMYDTANGNFVEVKRDKKKASMFESTHEDEDPEATE